jgi:hypothetical protein
LLEAVVALVVFVYVVGVAALTMVLGGVVLHALSPNRTFNIFHALHQQFVVGTLLGLAMFWLLLPHSWVHGSDTDEVREPAQSAGETEGGGFNNVTALSEYRGRGPSHRPGKRGEVAG